MCNKNIIIGCNKLKHDIFESTISCWDENQAET